VTGAVQFLNIFFVFLSDASYALIVGVLLAETWMKATVAEPHSLVRPLRSLAGLLLTAHLVFPWFVAASMTGSAQFLTALNAVPDVLTATRQGKLWIAGLALIVLLIAGIASRRGTVAPWLLAALILLLAAVKAASGHPADEGDFTITEFSQFLHILGTAVWAGTVIVSGILVVPWLARTADVKTIWSYGSRLSTVVTWAVAALLVSGIWTADRELNNSLGALWTSTWGRTLLAKLTFILIALALGAMNRYKGLSNPPTIQSTTLLGRLLRTEASVMLIVLGLSALLANTPPAMAGH
jgi:putative copper resistance protein D